MAQRACPLSRFLNAQKEKPLFTFTLLTLLYKTYPLVRVSMEEIKRLGFLVNKVSAYYHGK